MSEQSASEARDRRTFSLLSQARGERDRREVLKFQDWRIAQELRRALSTSYGGDNNRLSDFDRSGISELCWSPSHLQSRTGNTALATPILGCAILLAGILINYEHDLIQASKHPCLRIDIFT